MNVLPHGILALALLFPTLAVAETRYPLIIQDSMGHQLLIEKQPRSVSSKTLFTDEVLLSILSPERLTSLTDLANDENYSNISAQLPADVPLLGFSIEAILANAPDLVFAANWSDAGLVEQLKQAGILVYLIDTPFTVAGIQSEIRNLGVLLNVSAEAEALVANMEARLTALAPLRSKVASAQLTALDYNNWGTSSGVDTTWHAVLSGSGIINGSGEYEQGDFGQVPMSKELIVSIDPDILFLPGWIYGDQQGASKFYEGVINDPALADVKAIKQGRIYQVPSNLRGTYSQYLVDTIAYVVTTVSADID